MSYHTPFFSIIVTTYNLEQYVCTCLDSLIAQTFQNYEIIIVDDCSFDTTIQKIQPYLTLYPHITLIPLSKNQGPGNARNVGITHAKGTWIAFVDGDDWIDAARLQTLHTAIHQSVTPIDIVADDHLLAYDPDTIQKETLFKKVGLGQHTILTLPLLLQTTPAIHPIIRTQFLLEHKITFPIQYPGCEDYAVWLSSLVHGAHVALVHQPLYMYRLRANSLSSNRLRIYESMLFHTQSTFSVATNPVHKKLLRAKIKEMQIKRKTYHVLVHRGIKTILQLISLLPHTLWYCMFIYRKILKKIKP